MASTTDQVLYGVKQINITNLESDGSADASATEYTIDNPQRVSIAAVYEDGERNVLRGGDEIIAVIEEDDKLIGFDLTVELAELMPEVDETICGGTATPASGKWESPKTSSEDPYPFEMVMWVKNYDESDSNSTQDGYIKFTFNFCKGRRSTQEVADKSFGTPTYEVRARVNISGGAGNYESAMEYEKVASIS